MTLRQVLGIGYGQQGDTTSRRQGHWEVTGAIPQQGLSISPQTMGEFLQGGGAY